MSKSRLLQVSEAAELIEKVTGEPRFEVARRINHAGQFEGLGFFNKAGQPVSWMPGVYSVVEDDEGRRELAGNRFFRVDIGELMAAFGYHPETQAAILAELENPTPIFSSAKKEAPRGVTKAEILAADWPQINGAPPMEKIVTDPNAWAKPARVSRGSPGKESSLWNPAKLAMCLRSPASRRAWSGPPVSLLTTVINKNFPDYADEWAEYAERLKCGE